MEPFFSVEERMKLILSIINHAKITFADAYKLSNLDLETLHRLISEKCRLQYEIDTDVWEEDCGEWGDDDLINDTNTYNF